MTRSAVHDTDHPAAISLKGQCTRCRYTMFWKILEPFTTPSGRVEILCPSCRMDRETSCKEA